MTLVTIALEEIRRLNQIAFTKHEDLQKWREKPLDAVERTTLCYDLKQALERIESITKVLMERVEDGKIIEQS